MTIIGAWRSRWLDLAVSIYFYNEHRGYTALDRVLEAVRSHAPDDLRSLPRSNSIAATSGSII